MDSRYPACAGTGSAGMTIECKCLSFPCFHRGRLCGSRNPEISKCDFICICLYWFPACAGTGLDSCFRRNDDLILGMTT